MPTLAGGTPVGLTLGADGLTRLLWMNPHGGATLWMISPSGTVVRAVSIRRSPAREMPTALGIGADNLSRLLWSDGAGHASLLTVSATGRRSPFEAFTLPGGGTAAQIAVGRAGELRVLWEAPDGSGQLQTLTPQGAQTSVQALTPYL